MRSSHKYAAAIIITALVTAIVYQPLSVAAYKLREPYFQYPIKPDCGKIVIRNDALGDGEYGSKRRNGRIHNGIDISAAPWTPVYAAGSGIAFRGNVPRGYGKYVMIYHPDGAQTFYGHLADWFITSAQRVRRGDIIGFVGKTGNAESRSIQPHLHFEIRKGGEPVDPGPLMRP